MIGIGIDMMQPGPPGGGGFGVPPLPNSNVLVSATPTTVAILQAAGGNARVAAAMLAITASFPPSGAPSNANLSGAALPPAIVLPASGAASAPWVSCAHYVPTPAQIAASAIIDWWDTRSSSITQSSGAVSNWAGLVNTRNWTQSTAGRKPNVITDGWSAGIDSIDFDTASAGNEDVMVSSDATALTKVYSFGFVYNAHTVATNNVYLLDSNQVLIATHESTAGTGGLRALGFYDGTHSAFGTDTSITGKQAVLFTFSDETIAGTTGRCRVYRGGAQVGTDMAYVCKTLGATLGLFGSKLQNGQWQDGEIVDLAMWNRVLTTGERQLYFDYTLAKYGV